MPELVLVVQVDVKKRQAAASDGLERFNGKVVAAAKVVLQASGTECKVPTTHTQLSVAKLTRVCVL